jgi:hypothetical protein
MSMVLLITFFIFPIRLQGKSKGKRVRQRFAADILRAILSLPFPSLLRRSSPSEPNHTHPLLLTPPRNCGNVSSTLAKALAELFFLRRGLLPTVPMEYHYVLFFLLGFLLLPPSLLLGLRFVFVVLVWQLEAGWWAEWFPGGLSLVGFARLP